MTESPILEVKDLHTYYGASHILHGVSFSVGRGESVSLMGRNGMGKTTTLRSIFGLTPPSRGDIRFCDEVITGLAPEEISQRYMAIVPEGRGIFPNLTVLENLIMAARPGRTGRAEWTKARVLDVFPRLAERLDHRGDQISGGEQQMLSIGRALMTNPELLLLDEVTEGLAPLVREKIWAVIRDIKQAGIATLIVDKNVDALVSVCDRCMILAKGRMVYTGTSQELARNPELHLRHLGV